MLFIVAGYNSSTLCSMIFGTLVSWECRMLCKFMLGLSHMMSSRLDMKMTYKSHKYTALQFLQQMKLAAFTQILRGIITFTVNMPFKHITFQWETVLKFLMRHEDIQCVYMATLGNIQHNTNSQYSLITKVQFNTRLRIVLQCLVCQKGKTQMVG